MDHGWPVQRKEKKVFLTLIIGLIEHIYIDDIALDDNGDINLQVINDVGIGGLNNYYKLEKIAHYPYFRV